MPFEAQPVNESLHETWLFFPPEISQPSFPHKGTRSSVWFFYGPLLAQG